MPIKTPFMSDYTHLYNFFCTKIRQPVSFEITGDKDYTNGTTQKWQANAKVLVHYKVFIFSLHVLKALLLFEKKK